jgi:hypothetical protein
VELDDVYVARTDARGSVGARGRGARRWGAGQIVDLSDLRGP